MAWDVSSRWWTEDEVATALEAPPARKGLGWDRIEGKMLRQLLDPSLYRPCHHPIQRMPHPCSFPQNLEDWSYSSPPQGPGPRPSGILVLPPDLPSSDAR